MIGRLLAGLFQRTPPAIGPGEAHAASNHGSAVLLDVREPGEWQAGHAPQADHIPLGQLEDRLAELPRDRHIITVCRSGRRSVLAARLLAARGYQAINLTGGMTAWAYAGLPVVTATGSSPGRIL